MIRRSKIQIASLAACLTLSSHFALAAEGLPTPKELIAKYVQATGGEKTMRATRSMRSKGKMEMPMGMSGELELFAAAPNKMLMSMELPNLGTIKTGYDGKVAWIENPMTGPMIIEGDQLKEMLNQSDFYRDLKYDELYPTQETMEKTEFAGQSAYKVRLVDPSGKELFEYFAVDSGLKIGFEGEQTNEMGVMFVTTELSDYRSVDGRSMPMTTVAKMMGMEMKMVLEDVSFNSVDDAIFALPENIKTLAGAEKP